MDLAPCAADPARSRGRRHQEPPPSLRSEYQRDRDRIVHSAAFRRLEYKTQVFVNHEGDLFRTRLTHSLEVAQIARSVARTLSLNEDLCETISLAHDLGHTPFGHAGQDALDECMKDYGGFEHNLQSLRVVDQLEDKYANFRGLNLCFETREGILKHCSPKNAALLGDVGRRFLEHKQPGLEAQVANFADEIAYNNHDIDDGLRAGLLGIEQLRSVPLFARHHDTARAAHRGMSPKQERHETIRRIISSLVTDLVDASRKRIDAAQPADIDAVRTQPGPLVGYSDSVREENRQMKRFLRDNLYMHHQVYRVMTKARTVIRDLFGALFPDPRLMPPEIFLEAQEMEKANGLAGRARAVSDYIAGMTDRYALDEHERLFDPRRLR